MATPQMIYEFLDRKAPFDTQLDFDNAGFLVGRRDKAVSKVLVALDITHDVIDEAIALGAGLIVSHHPVIWGQISSVTDRDQTGQRLLKLIEHGISAICAHTNLDVAEGGVNSELARLLQLRNPVPLQLDGVTEAGVPYGTGRVGLRQGGATSLELFVRELKETLQVDGVRVMDAGRAVHQVAVGGGACGSMLPDALRHGCDTFVTSDLKHDLYLEAKAQGINLIDAGHYSTEAVICPVLVQWLAQAFPTLTVLLSKRQQEVFETK